MICYKRGCPRTECTTTLQRKKEETVSETVTGPKVIKGSMPQKNLRKQQQPGRAQ